MGSRSAGLGLPSVTMKFGSVVASVGSAGMVGGV